MARFLCWPSLGLGFETMLRRQIDGVNRANKHSKMMKVVAFNSDTNSFRLAILGDRSPDLPRGRSGQI